MVSELKEVHMSEKYTPKVGDKVRATLGENVLVGEVAEVGRTIVEIQMAGVPQELWTLTFSDGWQFEQIVSVPSKFGAVIRRADGEVFQISDQNPAIRRWFGKGGKGFSKAEATRGGFTVLFDGVDE
jgi:hypothetical protein